MKFIGIAHAAYNVSDMEKALEFYAGKLGFKHAFSIKNDKGEDWIEYLYVARGQFLELFYSKGGFDTNPSYNHLCLQVEDCYAAAAELESKGVTLDVKPQQGKDFNYQCWIHDPDGNRVEIMQIDPASPQAGFTD